MEVKDLFKNNSEALQDIILSVSRESLQHSINQVPIHEAIIEKDFWLCTVLNYLFNICNFQFNGCYLKNSLYFKGGTSLSKVFNTINRFSEDIDLVLDWKILGYNDNLFSDNETSNQKTKKLIKEMVEKKELFLQELVEKLKTEAIFSELNIQFSYEESYIKCIYPKIFTLDALLPEIRLEIGSLSAIMPHNVTNINSYIVEYEPSLCNKIPELFLNEISIKVIKMKRTFYEKLTILHKEANRLDKNYKTRYARHYYDVYKIITNNNKIHLYDNKLLENVIYFNKKFHPCGWAKYDEILKSGFKLIPPREEIINFLKSDYFNMKNMIFDDDIPFEKILATIEEYEKNINHSICLDNQTT